MWKQCRECLEQFWTRLLKEYLATLRTKSKWHMTSDQLKEGDVVWIRQNNKPRGQWPIGLVEPAIRGPDGEVRSCYPQNASRKNTQTSSDAKSHHRIIEDSHTQQSTTNTTQRSSPLLNRCAPST